MHQHCCDMVGLHQGEHTVVEVGRPARTSPISTNLLCYYLFAPTGEAMMLYMPDGWPCHGQPTWSTRRSGRVPPGPTLHLCMMLLYVEHKSVLSHVGLAVAYSAPAHSTCAAAMLAAPNRLLLHPYTTRGLVHLPTLLPLKS
jgi:hypothetical protein